MIDSMLEKKTYPFVIKTVTELGKLKHIGIYRLLEKMFHRGILYWTHNRLSEAVLHCTVPNYPYTVSLFSVNILTFSWSSSFLMNNGCIFVRFQSMKTNFKCLTETTHNLLIYQTLTLLKIYKLSLILNSKLDLVHVYMVQKLLPIIWMDAEKSLLCKIRCITRSVPE